MAEGAKMVGASQGTAQQRAFTQEGVKGSRKGCTVPEMVDLSFQYRRTHTRDIVCNIQECKHSHKESYRNRSD